MERLLRMLFQAADQKNTEPSTVMSAREKKNVYCTELMFLRTNKIWWMPIKKYRYTPKTIKPTIITRNDFLIEKNLAKDTYSHS